MTPKEKAKNFDLSVKVNKVLADMSEDRSSAPDDDCMDIFYEYLSSCVNVFGGGLVKHLQTIVDEIKRSKSPASTSKSNHGAFDGGLLCHTAAVTHMARKSIETFHSCLSGKSQEERELSESVVVVACILHDLNKLRTLSGEPYYIENLLKGGERSQPKPWKRNSPETHLEQFHRRFVIPSQYASVLPDGAFSVREGSFSLIIAEDISPGIISLLPEKVIHCVLFHDGLYSRVGSFDSFMSPELLSVHFADMMASRFSA